MGSLSAVFSITFPLFSDYYLLIVCIILAFISAIFLLPMVIKDIVEIKNQRKVDNQNSNYTS